MDVIECMTLDEYRLRMKAYQLTRVDREYFIYLQAWVNRDVQSEKKKGRKTEPYYKLFKDFFDYEKRMRTIDGKESEQEARLKLFAKRQQEFRSWKHGKI